MTITEIESRGYMREAFEDLEPLRVIIWPRQAGKTSFMGYEVGVFSHLPSMHTVIVHHSEAARSQFESHLSGIEASSYTSISYSTLVQTSFLLVQALENRQILLYFSEPDLFHPVGEPTAAAEPTTVCGEFVADLLLARTKIRQITYIGTAMSRGSTSRLARAGKIAEFVHSAHPREVYGADWHESFAAMKNCMPEEMLRTQVLGHY